MKLLLIIGILLTILFGFSISAYLVQYKFRLQNLFAKTAGFLAIGAVVTIITFTLAVVAIWPPLF